MEAVVHPGSLPLSLRWRHNGRDSVSIHQPHDCLLNHLFRRRSKKISKLCVTGLCAGNSPGTGEFPAQMASNVENVSIWWRHHDAASYIASDNIMTTLLVFCKCTETKSLFGSENLSSEAKGVIRYFYADSATVSICNVCNRYMVNEESMWFYSNFITYNYVIMRAMASQITSLTIVYSTAYSGADQRKHQSSASLAFVRGIHRWPVNSPHKGPVTRKMFPFDDVIMIHWGLNKRGH